jgi:hypothetical protein
MKSVARQSAAKQYLLTPHIVIARFMRATYFSFSKGKWVTRIAREKRATG